MSTSREAAVVCNVGSDWTQVAVAAAQGGDLEHARRVLEEVRVLIKGVPCEAWKKLRELIDTFDPNPHYDDVNRTLFYHGKVIATFHVKAENQHAILKAFESAGWNPLPDNPIKAEGHVGAEAARRALGEAIVSLNEKLSAADIKFHLDGHGGVTGIRRVEIATKGESIPPCTPLVGLQPQVYYADSASSDGSNQAITGVWRCRAPVAAARKYPFGFGEFCFRFRVWWV